ncbi:MAG: 50S ribosomal protein L9 [Phycisphaerales bacterium]|jgi:large subunit ribosomal protein L9|nr:50S ribosomal protein L9 [Phycisphaerales bacterium]
MAMKRVNLLLLENVEGLGIVGDVVRAKRGYASNFLIPHGLAEPPTKHRIAALAERRAEAEAELQALRSARVELLTRMEAVTISVVRSCNDQGALYGSVSQRDIADALVEAGYNVGVRSVRLAQSIRRVGEYLVPIQFDKDLKTDVTLIVKPDRTLEELEDNDETPDDQEQKDQTPETGAEDETSASATETEEAATQS